MNCEPWREAISARADGESTGIEPRLLEAHLSRCADCRAFEAAVDTSRVVTFGPAAPPPDFAKRVTKLAAMADRASRWSIARVVLAVVAMEIIALSVPSLIFGDDQGAADHSARHLAAFTVAYGAGLLVVVVRPARARAMLMVSLVLAGALVITAAIDLLNGDIPLLGEAQHIPELISVVLIWLMTVPSPRPFAHLRRRTGFEDTDIRLVVPERDAG